MNADTMNLLESLGETQEKIVRAIAKAGKPVTGAEIYLLESFETQPQMYNALSAFAKDPNGPVVRSKQDGGGRFLYRLRDGIDPSAITAVQHVRPDNHHKDKPDTQQPKPRKGEYNKAQKTAEITPDALGVLVIVRMQIKELKEESEHKPIRLREREKIVQGWVEEDGQTG